MRTAAAARSATTGPRPARSTPLSRPPAISTIGASNARSAAMTASGCVPCESLTKRTPSMSATDSRRCSTPVNAAAAARIASGATPNSSADRDRGQGVRDVVGARDRQLADRHDPAARPGRRRPAAREREPLDARGDDPAVDDAEPAGHRPLAPVQDGAAPAEAGVRRRRPGPRR